MIDGDGDDDGGGGGGDGDSNPKTLSYKAEASRMCILAKLKILVLLAKYILHANLGFSLLQSLHASFVEPDSFSPGRNNPCRTYCAPT